jgi:hypothetical protein
LDLQAVVKAVESVSAAPVASATRAVGSGGATVPARAVGSYVPRLTRKAFEKFGFATATLLTDWSSIVGPQTARYASPDRLKWPKGFDVLDEGGEPGRRGRPGATLIVRAHPGRALDVQYQARQIIDRINAYFGYRAVAELRIIQASMESSAPPSAMPKPREVIARKPQPIAVPLDRIDDAPLKAALERMRAGIEGRSRSRA